LKLAAEVLKLEVGQAEPEPEEDVLKPKLEKILASVASTASSSVEKRDIFIYL
jgi:hypothetical protein